MSLVTRIENESDLNDATLYGARYSYTHCAVLIGVTLALLFEIWIIYNQPPYVGYMNRLTIYEQTY